MLSPWLRHKARRWRRCASSCVRSRRACRRHRRARAPAAHRRRRSIATFRRRRPPSATANSVHAGSAVSAPTERLEKRLREVEARAAAAAGGSKAREDTLLRLQSRVDALAAEAQASNATLEAVRAVASPEALQAHAASVEEASRARVVADGHVGRRAGEAAPEARSRQLRRRGARGRCGGGRRNAA